MERLGQLEEAGEGWVEGGKVTEAAVNLREPHVYHSWFA